MSTRRGIRYRLATVVLLGVLTSALSLLALVQLLSTSTANRSERAHDAVVETIDRISSDPARLSDPPHIEIVGMRGGVVEGTTDVPSSVPPDWAPGMRSLFTQPLATTHVTTLDIPLADNHLIVGARLLEIPAKPGGSSGPTRSIAWSGYEVHPLSSLATWRWIIVFLALATALLVVSASYIVVTMHRGARAINASLRMLATNLDAPIARPKVRELSDVAEGIGQLAERLSQARREEARLGGELARQERLVALGRVVAGVAHEVRNPLASIKLRLDLAVVDNARTEPHRRLTEAAESAIAHASSEIARLDRLVADLLVVAGGAPGTRRDGSLGGLARSRVFALAPWAKERNVHLFVDGDARAYFDEDAVARAIDNLLRNAVDASPAGAEVRVRVSLLAPGAPGSADLAQVDVEDRGIGVASARAAELFEPFFTTKADGSGLGLALSRSIARSHGGDVSYVRAGERTHFVLTVSAQAPANEAADSDDGRVAEAAQ